MIYAIETTEGQVWQEEFPRATDAFAWAVEAIKGERASEIICTINTSDDTVCGVVTVWIGRVREQHHIKISPWRAAA